MSRESNFNIITGQVKRDIPLNPNNNKRFASHAEIRTAKQNGDYSHPLPHIKRLGTSSDCKAFKYAPENRKLEAYQTIDSAQTMNGVGQEKHSLINASKLAFNFISHSHAPEASETGKWDNFRKMAPFSKQVHRMRLNAPNLSKDFSEKYNSSQLSAFHRKKAACTEMCEIQRSYGLDKLFRKYK